jgi:putative endonuclease
VAKPEPFMAFTYVYILQSEVDPERFYTGSANNLRERLKRHNDGSVPHTSKWRPWKLKTYIAMSDRQRAAELEKYLKSHSGRAFVKKHL